MFTLRNKVVLSSVLAALLFSGCGDESVQQPLSPNVTQNVLLSPAIQPLSVDNRNAYDDQHSDADLSPDFIDPDTVNSGVEDKGCKTYEDGEDGTTDGWGIFDADPSGASVTNETENGSHVIVLHGEGIQNGFYLRRSNGDLWNNTDADTVQWSGKFSDDFIVFVSVLLDNGAVKYLSYSPQRHPQINDVFPFILPENASDGQWHTYTRNLEEDIRHYLPGREIKSVLDFQVRGSGALDDIALLKSQGCDSDTQNGDSCNNSGCNSSGTSIDFRYKVSIDIDYALKIDGAQDVDTAALPDSIAAQIEAILAALNGGGTGTSDADLANLLASAQEVLTLAQNLLALSNNLPAGTSAEYIQAMLRLSDDIGKMADRIGEMADRILETEDKIVVVALRMLESIDKAQESLLQAQQNFNDMLQIITSGAGEMTSQMADLLAQLQAAIASGDTSMINTIMQALSALLQNMSQLPSSILGNDAMQQMMLQMMTMMQQMMTQMMQGGFTAMNTGMEQFGQLMQQFITAMADPNSGVSPVRMAEVMTGTIENMMQMSKELLEKSMETGHSEEAIEAMREFSQFLQNMADKALVAMDKMGAMGGMAQEVAFRMLDLMEITEQNLLQAQQNFNNLILGLAGGGTSGS